MESFTYPAPSLSELLKCILPITQFEPLLFYNCRVLDGAAVVHFLPITGAVTFNDYAENIFIPYLSMQLQNSKRIDVVWDTYLPDSLKESTQEKRGKGLRRKVLGQAKLPGKWMDFLRDSKNKTELFTFLTDQISKFTFLPSKIHWLRHIWAVCFTNWFHKLGVCDHIIFNITIMYHIITIITITFYAYKFKSHMSIHLSLCDLSAN